MRVALTLLMTVALLSGVMSSAYAVVTDANQKRAEFASSLEEILGHLWALEQNLDDNNAELAMVHATHPIAELYDSIKPELKAADPALDMQMYETLLGLPNKLNVANDVPRAKIQQAVDDAKKVVELARSAVVGDYQSSLIDTKLVLIKGLLETSVAEYGEAINDDGVIQEMAEFQDGSAFVWRSQQIFTEIESDIDEHTAKEIDELYEELWAAYDARASPLQVETLVDGVTDKIDEILGVDNEEKDLLEYVKNIEELLKQTRQEYAKGNVDMAQSLATKAYLDNYEFLEAPLIELGQRELMEKVEIMMREELRGMIKSGQPVSQVNAQIDLIQEEMNGIGMIVPEFGTIAMMVLVVAITGVIALSAKSRISSLTFR